MRIIENPSKGEDLKQTDFQAVNKEDLVDIRDVRINPDLSKEERIKDFILQIKNPYLFRCGNLVVQCVFDDTDVTLTERLEQYFKTISQSF